MAGLAILASACSVIRPPGVAVAVARAGKLALSLQIQGRIETRQAWEVRSPAAGTVVALAVKDGDRVAAGDPLLEVDSPQVKGAVAQAEAAYRQAWSQYAAVSRLQGVDVAGLQALLGMLEQSFAGVAAAARAVAPLLPPERASLLLAQVDEAEAGFARAKEQASEALLRAGASSSQVLVALKGTARANLDAARTALDVARDQEAALRVRSPGSGVVALAPVGGPSLSLPGGILGETTQGLGVGGGGGGSVLAEGSHVSPGQLLLTVYDDSGWAAVGEVSEDDVDRVSPGQKARVSVAAVKRTYPGVLRSVAPAPAPGREAPSYRVRLDLEVPGEEKGLKSGMSAEISLDLGETGPGVLVPDSAITGDEGRERVLVVEAGRVRSRRVKILGSDGVQAVVEGLSEGERVVIDPARVKEGQRARAVGG